MLVVGDGEIAPLLRAAGYEVKTTQPGPAVMAARSFQPDVILVDLDAAEAVPRLRLEPAILVAVTEGGGWTPGFRHVVPRGRVPLLLQRVLGTRDRA